MLIEEIRSDLNELQGSIKDKKIEDSTKSIFKRIYDKLLNLIEESIKNLKEENTKLKQEIMELRLQHNELHQEVILNSHIELYNVGLTI